MSKTPDRRYWRPGRVDEFGQLVDPDVDLQDRRRRREIRNREWDVLLAVALGGVAGAEARNALAQAIPHPAAGFPWSTLLINATGSLLLGAFMVVILELTSPHRLARPFFGTGVLGGYTTFSTFAVDAEKLLLAHRPAAAAGYVLLTITSCVGAVTVASVLTHNLGEAIIGWRIRRIRRARLRARQAGSNSS